MRTLKNIESQTFVYSNFLRTYLKENSPQAFRLVGARRGLIRNSVKNVTGKSSKKPKHRGVVLLDSLYFEDHVPVVRVYELQELATDNLRVKLVLIINDKTDVILLDVEAVVSTRQLKRRRRFQIEQAFYINRLSRHLEIAALRKRQNLIRKRPILVNV